MIGLLSVERKLGRAVYQQSSPECANAGRICTECWCGPCSLCQQAAAIKVYEQKLAAGEINATWVEDEIESEGKAGGGNWGKDDNKKIYKPTDL